MEEEINDVDEHEHQKGNDNGNKNDEGEEGTPREENPLQKTSNILENFKKRLERNDNSLFYDMFEILLTKMATIESSMSRIKQEQVRLSKKISIVENSTDYIGNTIDEMDVDVSDLIDGNMKLTSAAIKAENEIFSLQERVESLDIKTNKGCLTISGILLSEDESCKKAVQSFCKEKLGLPKKVKESNRRIKCEVLTLSGFSSWTLMILQ